MAICDTFSGAMSHPAENTKTKSLLTAVLSDLHFWIPAIVLLFGLWVLHWAR